MANVTFIIGNGLDIALGLKTSYRDFYKYVQVKGLHPNNRIYIAIKDDHETWADFELTLGTYTRYIEDMPVAKRAEESNKFHEELEELTLDLAKYLSERSAELDKLTAKHGITRTSFFDGLSGGQKDQIATIVDDSSSIKFNFITLNYTLTLEAIINSWNTLIVPGNILFRSIHHLHGDLTEDVTLGVNDESQLSSALDGNEKDDLIKPVLIESMNDGRIDTMKSIIEGSAIIVLFGTSIGETDKYIWKAVIDWLAGHPSRHIIIHKHDSSYTTESKQISRRKKLFMNEVRDGLLNKVSLDEDLKNRLRSRIFVIHNTDKLFVRRSA